MIPVPPSTTPLEHIYLGNQSPTFHVQILIPHYIPNYLGVGIGRSTEVSVKCRVKCRVKCSGRHKLLSLLGTDADLGPAPAPPRKIDEDPLAQGSRYRKYWEKEQAYIASAMRRAGVCLVCVLVTILFLV